jgi:hypothetical protein
MTWAPALGYVVAGGLLLVAIATRTDRRVLDLLGARGLRVAPGRPGPSQRAWILVGSVVGGSVAAVDLPTALVTAPALALMGWRLPVFMAARPRRPIEVEWPHLRPTFSTSSPWP